MDEMPDSKTSRMGPGLRFLLIGSLALNLIVAGLLVGAMAGNKKTSERPPRDGDLLGAYTRALPSQDRREIGRKIRDHYAEAGAERRRPRQELDAMLTALRAQPFDPAPVAELLERQAGISFERRAIAQEIWLRQVSDMTDAERAEYAGNILEALPVRRKGPPKKPGGE